MNHYKMRQQYPTDSGSKFFPKKRTLKHRLGLAAFLVAIPVMLLSEAASAKKTGSVQWLGHTPDFGPNVTIFDPSMTVGEIKAIADDIYQQQRDNEMGSARYSLLFMPGEYGTATEPLQIAVGYYTEVAGLGASPEDVQINGKVEAFNRCFDAAGNPAQEGDPNVVQCFALNNFWRSLSNLTINVNGLGQGGCEASSNFWAVSQAASMRRVQIKGGNLSLMDYCGPGPQFASGGFIADSKVLEGDLINGSQQQWITRGVIGAPEDAGYVGCVNTPLNCLPYTTLDTTPVSREKPYLYVDENGGFNVRVPSADQDTRGTTWTAQLTPGRTIPIADFFVAMPGDSIKNINKALNRGRHLILTPGVYDIGKSIKVKRADTIVLGMGLATLHAIKGATPLKTR